MEKWGLVIVASQSCESECQDVLYQTRQAHIALGRRAERMSRYLVLPQPVNSDMADILANEHTGVEVLTGTQPSDSAQPEGDIKVFLTDPLGNVMLWYNREHTGKQMLKDIEKLLRASRIG